MFCIIYLQQIFTSSIYVINSGCMNIHKRRNFYTLTGKVDTKFIYVIFIDIIYIYIFKLKNLV